MSSPKMITTVIVWILIIISISPGCWGQCPDGWDGFSCRRRNVALNRPTSQSSNYDNTLYHSGNAVDGKTGHSLFNTPCTHTAGGSGPYWTVTLDKSYWIYRFTIYNRNGNCASNSLCGARLNGFTVSVGTSSGNYTTCYQDRTNTPGGPGGLITQHCTSPVQGNIVKISLPSSAPLTLCEVLLYVCADGWYGETCNTRCRTPSICRRCDPTGTRCEECVDGWYGEACGRPCVTSTACSGCDSTGTRCRACVSGRYGEHCLRRCGNCYGKRGCNKQTGHCPEIGGTRCEAGYTGLLCSNRCNRGEYGPDCKKTCGFCAQGRTVCYITSGHCPEISTRCMPGYWGVKCDTACPVGKWGADCPSSCGHCYNGTVCDRFSGECTLSGGNPRCSAGYKGTRCVDPCDDGLWDADCMEPCGSCYNWTVCNKTSGECPVTEENPRCSAGYEDTDTTCRTPCTNGLWGENCLNSCGNCYNGTMCNKTSGECPVTEGNPQCSAGYGKVDTRCRTPCEAGFWGEDCNRTCNEHCDGGCQAKTGHCEGGCATGYTGQRCHKALEATADQGTSSPAGKIAGGTVGGILLVTVVVVIIIVLYRRRRSSTSNDKNLGFPMNPTERQDDHSEDMDTLQNRGQESNNVQGEVNGVEAALAYENPMTTVVSTDEFWEYCHRKKASDGFTAEYSKFPVGLHAKHDVADLPQNKLKSRYKNLVAYDHSRVVLKPSDKNGESDYINASYINGYEKAKKFIASQGPTDPIINDFMRMLWEQNVGTVVMVTNLVEDTKKKCNQYWPTEGSIEFGVIKVTLLDEKIYANYNIRTLHLANGTNKPKILKQFHFTAWPDHGAPSDASVLLDFRDKVLEHRSNLPGPIVVHCSAGIGRTGTFIALDYLINQAKEEGVVDVPACVELLRQQRVNMVQTQEQYEFLHEALAEALKLSDSAIPSVKFATVYSDLCSVDPVTGQSKMAAQFKILQEMTPKLDEASHKSAHLGENLSKNRNNRILAVDRCRPYLSTPVNGSNDYINAVFLPGYMKTRGFVLTQTPLPTTVVDFWRLVYDHGITTIVMIDHANARHKNVGIYWTEKKGTFGPFEAEVTDVDQREDFSAWTYELTFKEKKAHQPIKQFRYQKWQKKPSQESIPSFLTLLQSIEIWQKANQNAPILVHCRDGVTKSGLFCVAWSVLERLKVDQNVSILQTVKQMRNNRPEIITDPDQYRFLHQIVISYLDSYQTYANFS